MFAHKTKHECLLRGRLDEPVTRSFTAVNFLFLYFYDKGISMLHSLLEIPGNDLQKFYSTSVCFFFNDYTVVADMVEITLVKLNWRKIVSKELKPDNMRIYRTVFSNVRQFMLLLKAELPHVL